MRYPSVFFEIVVEDCNGNQFGLDTITGTEYKWKELKLSIKKNDKPNVGKTPTKNK